MKLPNARNAIIDIRKLRDYVLDPHDPRGRHKARVFLSALGFTADDAKELSDRIMIEILEAEAVLGELDSYGQRYTVDCRIGTEIGDAMVRTGWIIRSDENFPRMTTCYVIRER